MIYDANFDTLSQYSKENSLQVASALHDNLRSKLHFFLLQWRSCYNILYNKGLAAVNYFRNRGLDAFFCNRDLVAERRDCGKSGLSRKTRDIPAKRQT